MSEQRAANLRYFLFSFTAAFFVWSILYLFLVNVVHPYTAVLGAEAVTPQPQEEAYQPTAEDSLTILFLGIADTQAKSGSWLLAKFDPAQGHTVLTALPGHLQLLHDGTAETLSEVYAYGGIQYTRGLLESNLGIPIDRYVRLTPESFLVCAGAIGTVEYHLGEAMTLRREGATVELQAGLQLLDGAKALSLLLRPNASPEEAQRLLTELAAAVIQQRRDIALSTLSDQVFERIINRIDSNISYPDYALRKLAAEQYALREGEVTKIIPIAGKEEAGRYVAADTYIAALTQWFG